MWAAGGPAVARAAQVAVLASDDEVREFLTADRPALIVQDQRIEVAKLMEVSGPAMVLAAIRERARLRYEEPLTTRRRDQH